MVASKLGATGTAVLSMLMKKLNRQRRSCRAWSVVLQRLMATRRGGGGLSSTFLWVMCSVGTPWSPVGGATDGNSGLGPGAGPWVIDSPEGECFIAILCI